MGSRPRPRRLPVLVVAALGVVFGDIGTSPLYALRVVLERRRAAQTPVG